MCWYRKSALPRALEASLRQKTGERSPLTVLVLSRWHVAERQSRPGVTPHAMQTQINTITAALDALTLTEVTLRLEMKVGTPLDSTGGSEDSSAGICKLRCVGVT